MHQSQNTTGDIGSTIKGNQMEEAVGALGSQRGQVLFNGDEAKQQPQMQYDMPQPKTIPMPEDLAAETARRFQSIINYKTGLLSKALQNGEAQNFTGNYVAAHLLKYVFIPGGATLLSQSAPAYNITMEDIKEFMAADEPGSDFMRGNRFLESLMRGFEMNMRLPERRENTGSTEGSTPG